MSMPKRSPGTTLARPGQGGRNSFSPRAIFLPISVLTLGALFYVYSRTSIQAAKENAKRAREADGGSINWRNEGLRRHGALEKPEERTLWQQLLSGGGDADAAAKERREKQNKRLEMESRRVRQANPIEDGIRRAKEGRAGPGSKGGDD